MRLINISDIENIYTELKRDLQMFDNSHYADSMIGGMRSLMAAINKLPTAYDVEKVISELENVAYCKNIPTYDNPYTDGSVIDEDEAIDIVRRGGVK